MSSTNTKKAMSGEALTLIWPASDIALVIMIRDREMYTLSLELVYDLECVDGARRDRSPSATSAIGAAFSVANLPDGSLR